jgi:hypothetical protein
MFLLSFIYGSMVVFFGGNIDGSTSSMFEVNRPSPFSSFLGPIAIAVVSSIMGYEDNCCIKSSIVECCILLNVFICWNDFIDRD